MKKLYLAVGIITIIGASFLIDYVANSQYITEDLKITQTLNLEVGELHEFQYIKEGEIVGTFSYVIESTGNNYKMTSFIHATDAGKTIDLEGIYVFNDYFKPVSYELKVVEGAGVTNIVSEFDETNVTTTVSYADDRVELVTELESMDSLLIENLMPSYWDILFKATEFETGYRYLFNAFVPQAAKEFSFSLVVDNKPSTITVSGRSLECKVIRETQFELAFYLYEGELVQYEEINLDIVFTKIL